MGVCPAAYILRTFARRYVFSSPMFIRSFLRPEIFFSRGKEEVAKEDALFCATVFYVSFTEYSRRGEVCAGAHTMFKALPVIFRGMSAYLYRPRFRFYIASHRYAPQGTPASHAILSHDKRAINFCETAPSHPPSAFHACMSLSPFSSMNLLLVYWFT